MRRLRASRQRPTQTGGELLLRALEERAEGERIPEVVVDGTTGVLVDVNDVPGYARAMHWLHSHRPEMAVMSQAAAQRVRDQFSIQVMTDQWLPRASTGPLSVPDAGCERTVHLLYQRRSQEMFGFARRLGLGDEEAPDSPEAFHEALN